MAVVITRTPWIDDDGTGTTGTVLNNAMKTGLYNEIDTALAKVAQLAGGNSFTGNQGITGTVNVAGQGPHAFAAAAPGTGVVLGVRNTAAAVGTYSEINLGNDADPRLMVLNAFSSAYATTSFAWANGALVYAGGAGGLNLACSNASATAAMRFYTNNAERMRVGATGEVCINMTAPIPAIPGLVNVAFSTGNGVVFQNLNAAASNMLLFVTNAGTLAGFINQTGAAVAYNTSSDARLKLDEGRASDLSGLRAVVVHDFQWNGDGVRARGVFAQEAYDVFPSAITKGTDECTACGALTRPWMTDYSKFVPDLIVGFQQHDAELAELRATLAALKGFPNA